MRFPWLPFAAALLVAAGHACLADSILLDNGNTISGKILSESGTEIVVLVESGRVSLPRSRVVSVSRDLPSGEVLARAGKAADEGRFEEAVGLLLPFAWAGGADRRAAHALEAAYSGWFGREHASGRLSAARRIADGRLRALGDGPGQAEYGKALDELRGKVLGLRNQAADHAACGRFGDAGSAWIEALRADPAGLAPEAMRGLSESCAGRAEALRDRGDSSGAIRAFREAVAWMPSSAPRIEAACAEILALLALKTGDGPAAEGIAGQAEEFLETCPSSRLLWAVLGREGGAGSDGKYSGILSRMLPAGKHAGPAGSMEALLALAGSLDMDAAAGKDGGIGVLGPDGESSAVRMSAALNAARIGRLWPGNGRRRIQFSFRIGNHAAGPAGQPGQAAEGSCSVSAGPGSGAAALILLSGDAGRLAAEVVPHEMGHAYFEISCGAGAGLPMWIHEGAAIWAAPAAVKAHTALLLCLYAADGQAVPLDALIAAADFRELEDSGGLRGSPLALNCAYLFSFGLFEFLVSRKGIDGIRDLCAEMRGLHPSVALCSVYGFADLKALEKGFVDWIAAEFPPPWESGKILERHLGPPR